MHAPTRPSVSGSGPGPAGGSTGRRPVRPTARCAGVGARRAAAATVAALALAVGGCTDASTDPAQATLTTPAATGEPSGTAPASPAPSPSVPAADEHSAVGALPDDFPSALLPVPQDAEILVATYAPEADAGPGQPYAVSLNVRTALSVEEVVAVYRSSLTAAGFTEGAGGPGGSLTGESTFTRSGGQEIVVIGVLDRDGSRTVTAGGRVLSP